MEFGKTIVRDDFGFRSKDRETEKSFKPALIGNLGARSFLKSISDEEMKSSLRNKIPKAKRLNVTDMIGNSELKSIQEKKKQPKKEKKRPPPSIKGPTTMTTFSSYIFTSSHDPSSLSSSNPTSIPSSSAPSSMPSSSNPSSS